MTLFTQNQQLIWLPLKRYHNSGHQLYRMIFTSIHNSASTHTDASADSIRAFVKDNLQ